MTNIISTTLYTIAILAVLFVAGLFVISLVPIPGNIKVKIVQSGSMEPAIQTGSIVVIKPEAAYSVGEVVTFGKDTRDEVPTTHRIVLVGGSGANPIFTTRGDANEEADPNPVLPSDIIGKVVLDVPYLGYILDFAKKPLGFTLMVAIPAGLIILDELRVIGREMLALRRRRSREETFV